MRCAINKSRSDETIINWYSWLLRESTTTRRLHHFYWTMEKCGESFADSGSGPYCFKFFTDDLDLQMDDNSGVFQYADDSNIVIPVWNNEALQTVC